MRVELPCRVPRRPCACCSGRLECIQHGRSVVGSVSLIDTTTTTTCGKRRCPRQRSNVNCHPGCCCHRSTVPPQLLMNLAQYGPALGALLSLQLLQAALLPLQGFSGTVAFLLGAANSLLQRHDYRLEYRLTYMDSQ